MVPQDNKDTILSATIQNANVVTFSKNNTYLNAQVVCYIALMAAMPPGSQETDVLAHFSLRACDSLLLTIKGFIAGPG